MALNINPNVDDVFYRYKMPRLQAKVEGKGNGIKTVIANMPDIAKALNRPPNYPTKYFGCELGAQTQLDAKNDRYIVNGEHDQAKLQEILYGFIRKFVLCPSCDNPETSLVLKKNQILQSCKACGHACTIDNKHKLTTYIIKNPPPIDDNADSSAGNKKKSGQSPGEENGDGDAFGANENRSPNNSDEAEDDDWQPEAPATNGVHELTGGMAGLVATAVSEKPLEERLDLFYNWVSEQKKKGNGALDPKAALVEAKRLDVTEKAGLLLGRALFSQDVVNQIKQYKPLLVRFTNDNPKAQRYLLGGLEQLIMAKENKAVLLPKTPIILKQLYDEDIVEEEAILDWAKKPSKRFVSKKENQEILDKAAPFVNWLQEAEEESDEEDGHVQFGSQPAAVRKEMVNGGAAKATNGEVKGDNDDLNIDDI